MAVTLRPTPLWPVGQSVTAHVARARTAGAPNAAALETVAAASDGSVTFTALSSGSYVAYALISGVHRYVEFVVPQGTGIAVGDLTFDPATQVELDAHTALTEQAHGGVWVKSEAPLNVKWDEYGAVGNGAVDDRAALQATLDAAATATKGAIFVPRSLYRVAPTAKPAGNPSNYPQVGLVVPRNVTLFGEGRKASVFTSDAIPAGAGEGWMAFLVNKNPTTDDGHIVIRDLGIDLPAPRETGVGMERYDNAIDFYGVHDAVIERVWMRNGSVAFYPNSVNLNTATWASGKGYANTVRSCLIEQGTQSLFLFQVVDCLLDDVTIDKVWDDPILIGSAGRGHRIRDCKINGSPVVSGKGAASGCIYLGNDGAAGAGSLANPATMEDIVIEGCKLSNLVMPAGSSSGVAFVGSRRNIKIVLCDIYGNGGEGIRDIDGAVIHGMQFIANDIHNNGSYGIRSGATLNASSYLRGRMLANVIRDNVNEGIDIYSGTGGGVYEAALAENTIFGHSGLARSISLLKEAGATIRLRLGPNDLLDTTPINNPGNMVPSVASQATLTLDAYSDLFVVTGTTAITSITASWPGRIVTLRFADSLTLTDGLNLSLAGNFVTTTDDTITLRCDGINWHEIGRSVN